MSPRLILIEGSVMSVYHGRERQGGWETGDPAHSVDREYLDQVLPVVFGDDWVREAVKTGRCFPLLA